MLKNFLENFCIWVLFGEYILVLAVDCPWN